MGVRGCVERGEIFNCVVSVLTSFTVNYLLQKSVFEFGLLLDKCPTERTTVNILWMIFWHYGCFNQLTILRWPSAVGSMLKSVYLLTQPAKLGLFSLVVGLGRFVFTCGDVGQVRDAVHGQSNESSPGEEIP